MCAGCAAMPAWDLPTLPSWAPAEFEVRAESRARLPSRSDDNWREDRITPDARETQ
jgi:hypothetical protein